MEPSNRDDAPEPGVGVADLPHTLPTPPVSGPNPHHDGATRYIVRRHGHAVKVSPCVVVRRLDVDLWLVSTTDGPQNVIGRHLVEQWEPAVRRDLTLAELAMRRAEVDRG